MNDTIYRFGPNRLKIASFEVLADVDPVFVIHPQCRIGIGNWNANVVNKGFRFGMWYAEGSLTDWIPGLGFFEDEQWIEE